MDNLKCSNTYGMYVDNVGLVDLRFQVDDLEALAQAIYLRLSTESLVYPIYSDGYGVSFVDLFGEPSYLVIPEVERRITESLLSDERILSVGEFEHKISKGVIEFSFKVYTVYGDLVLSREVNF